MADKRKLIGEYLLSDHLITPDQLQKGLQAQANQVRNGRMPLLGTVLVQMGAINNQDLAFALEEQERERMRINA